VYALQNFALGASAAPAGIANAATAPNASSATHKNRSLTMPRAFQL
jgi:hypothetical protein